jgi:succinate dehydrogenase flavin-adding protein (antitoxin of CptAB toxin-antitoxin module)
MSHSTAKNISGRLRWQCRRSCLEIDLLLNGFLDHPQGYSALSASEQDYFQILLDKDDADLLPWLMGREVCAVQHLQTVIEKIRQSA